MIVLGLILLIVGVVVDIGVLWWIGLVLVAVGAVLALVGAASGSVGGRRHWW